MQVCREAMDSLTEQMLNSKAHHPYTAHQFRHDCLPGCLALVLCMCKCLQACREAMDFLVEQMPKPQGQHKLTSHTSSSARAGSAAKHVSNVCACLQVCRGAMDFLVEQIRALELEAYQQLGLPMQIIHGDLHYDNVMVLGDNVSG